MNRLEAMSTLLAAVDAGSLSAASRRMGVPLATVSRRVSDLETHLRARLLIRTSRRLELTDAGRSYVDACREILASVAEAERAAAGEYSEPRGDIAITAPIVFGRLHLLPVVAEFLRVYPQINVRLRLTDRMASFAEEHIDIALRIGALPDSGLVAVKLGEVRWLVCASPSYLASLPKRPRQPSDLADCACITFEGLMSPTRWTFRGEKSEQSVDISSRLVVNTAEAAIDAACAGVGVTRVLSYQVASALRDGKLESLSPELASPPAPVHLVHVGQGPTPLKTRSFIDFAAKRLRRSLESALPPD